MPIYEFECPDCGKVFERLMRAGESAADLSCPDCGAIGPEKRVSRFQTNAWSGFLDGMEKRISPHKFK